MGHHDDPSPAQQAADESLSEDLNEQREQKLANRKALQEQAMSIVKLSGDPQWTSTPTKPNPGSSSSGGGGRFGPFPF